MPATHPFHSRILLAFDFDWTLGEDSFERLVAVMGFEVDEWKERFYRPLGDAGWDDILAKFEGLRRMCEKGGKRFAVEDAREAGRTTRGFDDAATMPRRLREIAERIDPQVRLEFAIVSSGYLDVFGAHPIADAFDRKYGSAFEVGDDGRLRGVKKMISHPEKVRYIQALAKGIDLGGSNAPSQTEADLAEEEQRVAFDQLIYVGDGASDLQAFGFVREMGGFAIAVSRGGEFSAKSEMLKAQRPDALAPPSYRDGAPLFEILAHAVRSHASRIALRRLGRDG
ncbi:hypothetical protein [Jiella avicenniae]|uniref:Haloacid dehalogenase-like hydrolase n=1 Tax=Jiella avicenniae TaxID=2907202 RepID=A0A9X1NYI1_9HYPH|nr:hypothetical protein [Jiella avicenniae]MCE7026731.1 hypothetical protein [Jiella avicenniae]